MRDELRSAYRALRASRSVTLVALAVLALGIGATTAIFSVVDAVVLRALPFDHPDELVAVGERNERTLAKPGADAQAIGIFSPQNYLDVAAQQRSFEGLSAVWTLGGTIGAAGSDPESVAFQRVSSTFFGLFRVQPILGRTFSSDDEVPGHDRVCVLSEALWRRRFAADRSIVGKTIPMADGPYEVIGVVGAGFSNPMSLQDTIDLWMPWVPTPDERVRHENARSFSIAAIARLKPGVSLQMAQGDLDRVADSMRQANPKWNQDVLVGARPLRDHLVDGRTTQWMWLLLGAVALVLAIACANVASLLLARAAVREREIAVRAALGASRARIIRQLLVESLMLSTAGAAAAMVVALWGVAILRRALPPAVPHVGPIAVDARVFLAAVALAVATGLLFGLAPALQASRADVSRALGDHGRAGTTSRRRSRFGSGLVIAEVALAMVLLVAAALFIGSFRTVMSIDVGFEPDRVVALNLAAPAGPRGPAAATSASGAIAGLVDALESSTGVVHAAFINGGTPVVGRGFSAMSTPTLKQFALRRITPEYFSVMGIPVRHGRAFDVDDRAGGELTAILNESAARAFFPGQDAIGRTLDLDGSRRIVGIVGDVREGGPERSLPTMVYVPLAQSPALMGDIVVKTAGDPDSVIPVLKATARRILPGSPVQSIQSMNEGITRLVALRRFNMMLLSLLGGLGLVIAAVGIYGLLAYLVAQREREIGVRMALGASRQSIARLVIGRAGLLVGSGLALGSFGAWALGGTAKAFLFRMSLGDPRVYACALAALVVAAAAATIIPAHRAAGVDPLVSLRSE